VWQSFWSFLWSTIVIFAFIAYLMILFNILTDLFWRDHQTKGVVKAVWVVFLIVFPYLTAFVYLIARGEGMALRARDAAAAAKQQTDDYIKTAAGRSPAQDIAHAKELLDAGTISPDEFAALKTKALA
jgi:uncharacterized membrane protein